jgi:ribonucleoside-diphosphate reductase alpha chain
VGVAPCGEVGLTTGETCQFGYINLGKFVDHEEGINYSDLEKVTRLMTRALDNALEYSLSRYSQSENQRVMRQKRKIGIGICGLADMFFQLRLPYNSFKARALAKNAVAFINYISKLESCRLARERGSFEAMRFARGCRYNDKPGFIEDKYGGVETEMVSSEMWQNLADEIRTTGLLRNASTVALPPTGRSGLVIDASTGVEPVFSLAERKGEINAFLRQELERQKIFTPALKEEIFRTGFIGGNGSLPEETRRVFQTALEINLQGHLLMVGELQQVVDESIAKTFNMPRDSAREDIMEVFFQAYQLGLKGITIYRRGSRSFEPMRLAEV